MAARVSHKGLSCVAVGCITRLTIAGGRRSAREHRWQVALQTMQELRLTRRTV
jgi:hypothetical protein